MSTETMTSWPRRIDSWQWIRGGIGGFIGSMAFGLWMMFIMPAPVLQVAVPQMYGIPATPDAPEFLAGWFFHLYHGVFLGFAYVALVEHDSIASIASPKSLSGSLTHGVLYGVITTVILAVLVMPIWLQGVDFAGAPAFPNISVPGTIMGLLGHVIFGVVLGITYGIFGR